MVQDSNSDQKLIEVAERAERLEALRPLLATCGPAGFRLLRKCLPRCSGSSMKRSRRTTARGDGLADCCRPIVISPPLPPVLLVDVSLEPHQKQSRMKQEFGSTRRTGGTGGINMNRKAETSRTHAWHA